MINKSYLKQIQDRLPDDLVIENETSYEFTEDEFIGILSWIKYFNVHYKAKQKGELPEIIFPIISKRMRLDFGLYISQSDTVMNKGKYVIYISPNGRLLNGDIQKQSVNQIIDTWRL